MILKRRLQARGFPSYDAFLERWWGWWERYEGHRGGAVEITLKNLARGLRGRDAATLVGDSPSSSACTSSKVIFFLLCSGSRQISASLCFKDL